MKQITLLFALLFLTLTVSAQMPHRDPSGLTRVVQEYTAGTTTWNKPAGLVYIEVYALGGGGGGGSGRRGAANTNRCGGSGGNGGNYAHGVFQAAQLATTYNVTAGAFGIGGPVQTIDNTDGNNGLPGGNSSFGSLVIAKGGNAGSGGKNGQSIGIPSQNYLNSNPSGSVTHRFGGDAGKGLTYTFSGQGSTYGEPTTSSSKQKTTPGGGGGTGIGDGNQTTQQPAAGTPGVVYVSQYANTNWNVVAYQPLGTGQNQGAAGANGATLPATNVLTQGTSLYFGSGGAGGGFGNTAGTIPGGFGGNGGPGAGGGGGGASTNGAVSGKGGNGGAGWVVVVEYIQE